MHLTGGDFGTVATNDSVAWPENTGFPGHATFG
jgi:hypothetical protein